MRTLLLTNMAAKERSGTAKRRSWGKPRQKEKMISIDRIDVAELTKITSNRSSSVKDLKHPELMSNQTLVDHLSGMKVVIPVCSDGEPSRGKLLYLFRKHVSPQPQRSGFWRRRRGGVRDVAMEVDHNFDTWTSSSKSWDLPLSRKRRHASDEDGDTPATKRPEEEARHVLGNTFLNDSSESDHVAKTTTVATTKKIIKIRRTSTSNYHSGSTNVHVPSEKVALQLSLSEDCH